MGSFSKKRIQSRLAPAVSKPPNLDWLLFSTQPLWFLWQQWKSRRNEEPGCKLQRRLHWKEMKLVKLPADAIFSSSSLKVLQEGHVWAEDAGRSRGRVPVCPFWSEACPLALKLHSLPKLHGDLAHMRTSVRMEKKKRAFFCPYKQSRTK